MREQPPAIRLGYEEATTLLMTALDQPAEARSAFQARIRQLQRIGLLRKHDAKTYERFTYGLVELAALATAFRLMAAFMLPILAVRYLSERWADFVPALVAGLGVEHGRNRWDSRDEATTSAGSLVAIEGNLLARLGQKSASDARYDGPLGTIRCVDADERSGSIWSKVPQGMLIDTRSYMVALADGIAALEQVNAVQLADEVDRLRFSGLDRPQSLAD